MLTPAQSLYKTCTERLEVRWGKRVRDLVGEELYHALMGEQLFYLLAGQDDSIDPARIVELLSELHTCLVDDTRE